MNNEVTIAKVIAFVSMAIVILALFMAVLVGVSYLRKEYHNVTTPISVTEVEKGVKCATATGTDSVAIACWKE
jgi:hypothetical protein